MDRARWRKLSKPNIRSCPSLHRGSRSGRSPVARFLAFAAFAWALSWANAARADIAILPSSDGHFGAWLVLGPAPATVKGNATPRTLESAVIAGTDEANVSGRLGRTVSFVPFESEGAAPSSATWALLASSSNSMDIAAAVSQRGPEAFAFLYGVLHLVEPLKGALMLGSSDGARIFIDHKKVSSSDYFRIERADEDIVRLDLPAGDHPILVKLHHRDNYWNARIRVVDTSFAPPRGAWLKLPGTVDDGARPLAQKMASIEFDRGVLPTGFRPEVTIAFQQGLPRGIDRFVRVSASTRSPRATQQLFAFDAGEVPLGELGPSPLKVRLPQITREDLGDALLDGELVLAVEIAGRKFESTSPLRSYLQQGAAAAERALAALGKDADTTFLADPSVTRATVEHLRDRFLRYADAGDSDSEALASEARVLESYAGDLDARRDPLRSHAGIQRFAYRSPLDGELSPFGVYIPESFAAEARAPEGSRTTSKDGSKTYPLVIALHGLNGKPVSMVRWFFGHDDEAKDSEWEDRHPGEVDPIEGFVVAPNGFGNAMYRELGEVDVVTVLEWAKRFFPIDKNRVTITGLSMGGTGAAQVALRYPDQFAAAEPLCGYHSYFIRRDITDRGMLPWEKLLSENRSNALWAENGLYLPLYVWHGKRDLPEKNSGVLIERYTALGYSIEHEHPNVGHDVWKRAYEGAAAFRWLSEKTRPTSKRRIVFKTDSPRYVDDAWVHLREISSELDFATIVAEVTGKSQIEVTTHGVYALALDRDPELLSAQTDTKVVIDGTTLSFSAGAPIVAYKAKSGWTAGEQPTEGRKRAGLSGPMRDAFFEPLIFVYGTMDPEHTRANRDTAKAWARIRGGVDARFPIVADVDFDQQLAETHSLVLVGDAQSNRILQSIDERLPFRVARDKGAIVSRPSGGASPQEWKGKDIGVAFIYPNPDHPSRYVLVLEGISALGTFRSVALPELLPDYMIFDDRIAPARGQIVLGNAAPVAAGLFRADWSLAR